MYVNYCVRGVCQSCHKNVFQVITSAPRVSHRLALSLRKQTKKNCFYCQGSVSYEASYVGDVAVLANEKFPVPNRAAVKQTHRLFTARNRKNPENAAPSVGRIYKGGKKRVAWGK